MIEAREQGEVLPGGILRIADKPRFLRDLRKMVGQQVTVHVFVGMSPKSHNYYRVVLEAIAEHCGYPADEMEEALELKFNPVVTDGQVHGGDFEDLNAEDWSKVFDRIIYFGRQIGADIRPPASEERKDSRESF